MQNNFPMLTLHSALTTGVKSEPLYENPISNKFGENSILKYSRTSTDSYFIFVPADSPYIASCWNLSTTATATKACPQLPK